MLLNGTKTIDYVNNQIGSRLVLLVWLSLCLLPDLRDCRAVSCDMLFVLMFILLCSTVSHVTEGV